MNSEKISNSEFALTTPIHARIYLKHVKKKKVLCLLINKKNLGYASIVCKTHPCDHHHFWLLITIVTSHWLDNVGLHIYMLWSLTPTFSTPSLLTSLIRQKHCQNQSGIYNHQYSQFTWLSHLIRLLYYDQFWQIVKLTNQPGDLCKHCIMGRKCQQIFRKCQVAREKEISYIYYVLLDFNQ